MKPARSGTYELVAYIWLLATIAAAGARST